MKAKEYLREFKKKHGISDVWEQHELLKLMNGYDSTASINKNDLSHNVSESTSDEFGTIVELEIEIDNICQLCKYGKNGIKNENACLKCGSLKLSQYYR